MCTIGSLCMVCSPQPSRTWFSKDIVDDLNPFQTKKLCSCRGTRKQWQREVGVSKALIIRPEGCVKEYTYVPRGLNPSPKRKRCRCTTSGGQDQETIVKSLHQPWLAFLWYGRASLILLFRDIVIFWAVMSRPWWLCAVLKNHALSCFLNKYYRPFKNFLILIISRSF